MLRANEMIDGQWRTLQRIGEGTFSEIYTAEHYSKREVAVVKCQKDGEDLLQEESEVHKILSKTGCVPKFYYYGVHKNHANKEFQVIIMELMGQSISDVRKKIKNRVFHPDDAVRITRAIIQCLKAMHSVGFIHRDIKPSNFVLNKSNGKTGLEIKAIDFGLTKQIFVGKEHYSKSTTHVQFRGTSMFASVKAHHYKDLSRRDDLWSVLFFLVLMLSGSLPWRELAHLKHGKNITHKQRSKIRGKITRMKEANFEDVNAHGFLKNIPKPYQQLCKALYNCIKSLRFEDEPDYDRIFAILDKQTPPHPPVALSEQSILLRAEEYRLQKKRGLHSVRRPYGHHGSPASAPRSKTHGSTLAPNRPSGHVAPYRSPARAFSQSTTPQPARAFSQSTTPQPARAFSQSTTPQPARPRQLARGEYRARSAQPPAPPVKHPEPPAAAAALPKAPPLPQSFKWAESCYQYLESSKKLELGSDSGSSLQKQYKKLESLLDECTQDSRKRFFSGWRKNKDNQMSLLTNVVQVAIHRVSRVSEGLKKQLKKLGKGKSKKRTKKRKRSEAHP